jgi:hypothetical protein
MKIEIDGEVFELLKRGRAQAIQIQEIGRWLSKYGSDLMGIIGSMPENMEDNLSQNLVYLGELLSSLSADAMVDLFRVAIGCTSEFAEEKFDVAILIDAVITIYNEHPTIKRLVDRFFSGNSSTSTGEDSSMISDVPTDGQMTNS